MGDVSDVFDGTTKADTFTGLIRAETPRIRNELLFMTDDDVLTSLGIDLLGK